MECLVVIYPPSCRGKPRLRGWYTDRQRGGRTGDFSRPVLADVNAEYSYTTDAKQRLVRQSDRHGREREQIGFGMQRKQMDTHLPPAQARTQTNKMLKTQFNLL